MPVVTTTFVISDYYSPPGKNKPDPTKVWVTFAGTFTNTGIPQTAGKQTLNPALAWQSVRLDQMKALVSASYFRGVPQYTFGLNGFSGRIYVNFGPTALTGPPDPGAPGTSPYIVFEPTVLGANNSNMDLSYVDGVSCAASIQLCDAATGKPLPALQRNPQATAGDIVSKVAGAVPTAAIVRSGTQIVRVMSSAAAPSAYHNWSSLMTYLEGITGTAPLRISSYNSSATDSIPIKYQVAGDLYGYSGAPPLSGQYAGFNEAQSYAMTAVFSADLNAGANPALAGLGVPQGTAGVKISGKGSKCEPVDIYITKSNLNLGVGIYGNNPSYVVISPAYKNGYATQGIADDLGGRIVGDLMAGIVFGWAASRTSIKQQAHRTGTDLYGVSFTAETVGGLPTGELFFLLSLAAAQNKLAHWIGPALDRNADHYDQYLSAVSAHTFAYASGFTDRLQGINSPDLNWYTTNPPTIPWEPTRKFPTVGFVNLLLGVPHKPT